MAKRLLPRGGSLFTNVITAAPYTLAATFASFTGLSPAENGVSGWLINPRKKARPEVKTLFDVASDEGHFSAVLATPSRQFFPARSLDEFFAVKNADEVISWLRESDKANLGASRFTYIHLDWLHDARIQLGAGGTFQQYREEFRNLQKDLSKIIDQMERISDHVVVSSDHGMLASDERAGSNHEDFTGNNLTNKTLRTFVWLSEKLDRNHSPLELRSSLDLFPTISRYLGSPQKTRDSEDFLTASLPGRKVWSETGGLYSSPFRSNSFSVQDDSLKATVALRSIRGRVMQFRPQLFDLKKDPEELKNIFWSHYSVNNQEEDPLTRFGMDFGLRTGVRNKGGPRGSSRAHRRQEPNAVIKRKLRGRELRFQVVRLEFIFGAAKSRFRLAFFGALDHGWAGRANFPR